MSDQQDSPSTEPSGLPPLYSLRTIGFATFFGSLLAGIYLMSANYRALTLYRMSYTTLIIGAVIFCLYFLMIQSFTGDAASSGEAAAPFQIDLRLAILSNIAQVIILLLAANTLQGPIFKTYAETDAPYHPMWRGILMGFAAYLALAVISMALMSNLGLVDLPVQEPV